MKKSWDLINESTRDSMHKKPAANFLAGPLVCFPLARGHRFSIKSDDEREML